jgi:hypothetical protein
MFQFNQLFQANYTLQGVRAINVQELLSYVNNASNYQFAVNPTKVKAILTSLTKGEPLTQMPVVARVTGNDTNYLVSGRHRCTAIHQLTENYGVSPTGKYVLRTAANEGTLQPIAGEVDCLVVECASLRDLNVYLVHANGSRSMTTAEKTTVQLATGTATPLQAFKSRVANALLQVLQVTPQTALDIVTAVCSSVSTFRYANPEEIQGVVTAFAEHFDGGEIPSNIARDYRTVVKAVLEQPMDDLGISYGEYLSSTITKPVGAAKTSKSNSMAEAQATIAELTRQLAALQGR